MIEPVGPDRIDYYFANLIAAFKGSSPAEELLITLPDPDDEEQTVEQQLRAFQSAFGI